MKDYTIAFIDAVRLVFGSIIAIIGLIIKFLFEIIGILMNLVIGGGLALAGYIYCEDGTWRYQDKVIEL